MAPPDASSTDPSTAPSTEISKLRAVLQLRAEVDDLLEVHQKHHATVGEVMETLLPLLCTHTGARGAFVQTFDEELALTLHRHPAGLVVPRWSQITGSCSAARGSRIVELLGGSGHDEGGDHAQEWLVAQPLDVGGTWCGIAGLLVPIPDPMEGPPEHPEHLLALLDMACEELDGFLMAVCAAREKHQLLMKIGDALRHPVLADGLTDAIAVLRSSTPLDSLLLVYLAEVTDTLPRTVTVEGGGQVSSVHVQLFEHGQRTIDTMARVGTSSAERDTLRRHAIAYLTSNDRTLLDELGFEKAHEEVLISGVTQTATIGKLVASSRSRAFNTTDRELLTGFGGFIRQRVVDFNKEWRRLAASFRAEDVARLLREADYASRFLSPREAVVAIAYADIAGFTRIAEQILRSPAAVGALIEAWSSEAVRLVWRHGGVFDKMVGDCIIALFGPPFYDRSPGEQLTSALQWAEALRTLTSSFPQRPEFAALRPEGLAVTTSVHSTPLFVGEFGPNDNFTGFSSGMNNTARLQGLAKRDEILVMAEAVESLPPGHGFVFGEVRSAPVKNVAAPIRFRALLGTQAT